MQYRGSPVNDNKRQSQSVRFLSGQFSRIVQNDDRLGYHRLARSAGRQYRRQYQRYTPLSTVAASESRRHPASFVQSASLRAATPPTYPRWAWSSISGEGLPDAAAAAPRRTVDAAGGSIRQSLFFFTRDAFTTHKRNAVNDIETRLTQLYFTTKRDSKKTE